MTTKKPRLTIYLTQEKRDYLESWAESDKRTLSNLVGLLIDEAIERRQEEVEAKKNPKYTER